VLHCTASKQHHVATQRERQHSAKDDFAVGEEEDRKKEYVADGHL
jgi:hypothetical protein